MVGGSLKPSFSQLFNCWKVLEVLVFQWTPGGPGSDWGQNQVLSSIMLSHLCFF